mmetsp:Transcript_51186/g.105875  ORF Transcript_51186/g.105875 Transcript_51186/m.105875 type:complete len:100 (+) Transcript_51186:421-720(+)
MLGEEGHILLAAAVCARAEVEDQMRKFVRDPTFQSVDPFQPLRGAAETRWIWMRNWAAPPSPRERLALPLALPPDKAPLALSDPHHLPVAKQVCPHMPR